MSKEHRSRRQGAGSLFFVKSEESCSLRSPVFFRGVSPLGLLGERLVDMQTNNEGDEDMSSEDNHLVPVNTRRCPVCGVSGMVLIPQGAWARYREGNELEYVAEHKRHQLETGLHARCAERLART